MLVAGAGESVDPGTGVLLARILAADVSLLLDRAGVGRRRPLGFLAPLDLEQAGTALDRYLKDVT